MKQMLRSALRLCFDRGNENRTLSIAAELTVREHLATMHDRPVPIDLLGASYRQELEDLYRSIRMRP
jgi:hypothetical protein